MADQKNVLYCAFCGKSQYEVRKLVAGPEAFNCHECIELCTEICDEESIKAFADRVARFLRRARRACQRVIGIAALSEAKKNVR